ncbi:mothers against decapentaplegic homolog 6-like [Mantella aurantiaca]
MFPSRRSLSARQLWRHRCGAASRGQGEGPPPSPEEPHHALRPAALQLFKKLKDGQLWQLAEAVESRGRWECGCVWYPLEGRPAKQVTAPCVLLCKLYRWPDLRSPSELKRLAHCQSYWRRDGEGTSVCCNPYHLSRLTVPGMTPLPPQPTDRASRLTVPEAAAPLSYKGRDISQPSPPKPLHPITNQESNVRGIHDTTLSRGSRQDGHWCKLAYWEHRSRVGHLYHVTEPSVQIFHDLPKGSGLCLGILGSVTRNEMVRRTRKKIGQGLILSREQGDAWVYNRSDHPVFINSPTLAPVNARGQSVHKLPPGHSIKVFDSQLAEMISRSSMMGEGPCDPHSVRISFAKGWGGSYSRQFITSCPCWLEVLLSTPK